MHGDRAVAAIGSVSLASRLLVGNLLRVLWGSRVELTGAGILEGGREKLC